jgi:WYL domain
MSILNIRVLFTRVYFFYLWHTLAMNTPTEQRLAFGMGEPKTGSRWGQERRLEFIDFRLQWDGKLNRGDITSFFGISVPQASADIARYQELRPENMEYDRSSRVYVKTSRFSPQFPVSHPSRYLNELLATATGLLPRDATFVGWWPSIGITPRPSRVLDVDVLTALLRAIRERKGLRICYQSMSRPEPNSRAITPHALAFDSFRWHVRAYCHTRSRFLDFVIARILKIESEEQAGPGQEEDIPWHTIVTLCLVPNPGLSKAKQRIVELDYGMDQGQLDLNCRQALLFYTLKQLGLDTETNGESEAQQVLLKNRAEVNSFRLDRTSE